MARAVPVMGEPAVLRSSREGVNLTPLAAARKLDLAESRVEQGKARPSRRPLPSFVRRLRSTGVPSQSAS